MDFDDSFFEDDQRKEDRKKKTSEIKYHPKICEPEVRPLHYQLIRKISHTYSGLLLLKQRNVVASKMLN